MSLRASRYLSLLLGFLTVPLGLAAQSGAIGGTVRSAEGFPIGGARIDVIGSGGLDAGGTQTRTDGTYRIAPLAEGVYTVRVRAIGYAQFTAQTVSVQSGQTTTVDATIQGEAAVFLPPVVVTADRQQQTVFETPASVQVVPRVEITERPATTVTDHLKSLPGIDISQGGLVQSNVVARGFNNIFSGAMLMLTDGRYAAVPSLRVNIPTFFPGTNEDIERIEAVLGPGSALYGPNSANGVLNIITRSPFSSQGTTISVEGGERDLVRTAFRHAGAPSPVFGYKISGEYLRGFDWKYSDPAEVGVTRDNNVRRWGYEARFDVRPDPNTEAIFSVGRTRAEKLVELTGIGAGQVRDWTYTSYHGRIKHKKFNAQAYLNTSNAGSTFLLRDGKPLVDNSRLWSVQAQHGFDIGSWESLTYGVDYIYTDARTDGTINGRNEDDDNIKEFGAYLYSVTRITPQWELVAALRRDKHSRLDDWVTSPRAALLYRPTPDHAIRFTYNRAFSTPSNNNLFLDISAGMAGPYTVRALGVPKDGFNFRAGQCTGGTDDLCMRVPDAFGGAQLGVLPAHAALLWNVAVGAFCQNPSAPAMACFALMNQIPAPTPAQVGTQLRALNPTTRQFKDVAPTDVTDVPPMRESITNMWELGYKGLIGQRAAISVDLWYTRKDNFVGPLIVESPNVFLDWSSTVAYLTPFLGTQNAQAIATAMAGVSEATSAASTGIPLATIVPDSPLNNNSDIFLTYRNFGEVDLYGADFSVDLALDNRFSVAGALSLTSDDFFPQAEVGGLSDIALNAPKGKGSLIGRFRDKGWSAEARMRSVKGFPVNSGVYVGETEGYTILDAQVAYHFAYPNVLISLSVQDVFDRGYATFVGVPTLGRMAMTKLSWTF